MKPLLRIPAALAAIFLSLSACTNSGELVTTTVVATKQATATTINATETKLSVLQTPTTASIPIVKPTETETRATLPDILAELEIAITNQNWSQMQSLMHDPLAVGAWRSEWRQYSPDQAIEQLGNGSLPLPAAVTFSRLSDDEITTLLGQPAATMFGPDVTIATTLHSSGWGENNADDAILFIADIDGHYSWYGFLYTTGRFADAYLSTVEAPAGLLYSIFEQGLYQVQSDGHHRELLTAADANRPNIAVSPDGHNVAYLDEEQKLWVIDTLSGHHMPLAEDYSLSPYLAWGGNNATLFVGVWLDPAESEGPNLGHLARINLGNRQLEILDETHLSSTRPALSPDGRSVAFDILPNGPADTYVSRLMQPDNGLSVFDPDSFTGTDTVIHGGSMNPAWDPSGERVAWIFSSGDQMGLQIFDLQEKTVIEIFTWDPARFGALIPSPIWSPDGQWLAIEVWANGPSGSGIWLVAADGSDTTLVDAQGRTPIWDDHSSLLFQVAGTIRLYDLSSATAAILELPANSQLHGITSEVDLAALPDYFLAVDTPVTYLTILQDVTIYNGPAATFTEIGAISDGQTALVTGYSFVTGWYRVICPDDSVGDCWVTNSPDFIVPFNLNNP